MEIEITYDSLLEKYPTFPQLLFKNILKVILYCSH